MAETFTFQSTIQMLQDTGVYQYILPFVLVFAIIFAILEKTKIFGEGKTNINALISVVIGLILIAQQGIVEIINSFLPRVSLILVVILMIIIVVATIAGGEFKGFKGAWLGLFILIGAVAVIVSVSSGSADWITSQDQDTLLAIGIPVLIIGGVVWLVTRSGEKEKPNKLKGVLESLGGALK